MECSSNSIADTDRLRAAGARFGAKGAHTSRTIMLAELTEVLSAVPQNGKRSAYEEAVVNDNCLGKATTSNRRITLQRLSELYGLDPTIPLFSVLRRLWDIDREGRPMLALICALARDPLLRATSDYILAMPNEAELLHDDFVAALRHCAHGRLSNAVLDQVRRNASSSWTQSGHLAGRVRKRRKMVAATFGPVALALWLGYLEGRVADDLIASFWMRPFDVPGHAIVEAVLRCKQSGLVSASIGGGVVQIDASPVYPIESKGTT